MQEKIEQSTYVLKSIISPAMHGGDVTWPQRPRHSQIDGESKSHICPYFLHTLWALPLQYSFYHILCVDVSSSDIYERVEKSTMIARLISDEHTT
jgi:hypothetical protein